MEESSKKECSNQVTSETSSTNAGKPTFEQGQHTCGSRVLYTEHSFPKRDCDRRLFQEEKKKSQAEVIAASFTD